MKKVTVTFTIECTEKAYKNQVSEMVHQIESGQFQREATSDGIKVKATSSVK